MAIRTTVFLPRKLHKRLKTLAADQDTTMSWLICEALVKCHDELDESCLLGTAKTRAERQAKYAQVLSDDELVIRQKELDERR